MSPELRGFSLQQDWIDPSSSTSGACRRGSMSRRRTFVPNGRPALIMGLRHQCRHFVEPACEPEAQCDPFCHVPIARAVFQGSGGLSALIRFPCRALLSSSRAAACQLLRSSHLGRGETFDNIRVQRRSRLFATVVSTRWAAVGAQATSAKWVSTHAKVCNMHGIYASMVLA